MQNKTRNGLLILALSIIAGLSSRLHGGGFARIPKQLKSFLCVFPFALITSIILWFDRGVLAKTGWHLVHTFNLFDDVEFNLLLKCILAVFFFIILIGGMIAKNTGHGGGMDNGNSTKEPFYGRTLEKLEYLIYPWAFKILSRKAYDSLLMFIIGCFRSLFHSFFLFLISPVAGLVSLFGGGIGTMIGYRIGWLIFPKGIGKSISHEFDEATEIGEFLGYALAMLSFCLAINVVGFFEILEVLL